MITKEEVLKTLSMYYNLNEDNINLDKLRSIHNSRAIANIDLNPLFRELTEFSSNPKLLRWALDGVVRNLQSELESNPPNKMDLNRFLDLLDTQLYRKATYGADQNSTRLNPS